MFPFLKEYDNDCDLFPVSPSTTTTTTPIVATTVAINGTAHKAERELGTKGDIIKNPLPLMTGQLGRCSPVCNIRRKRWDGYCY